MEPADSLWAYIKGGVPKAAILIRTFFWGNTDNFRAISEDMPMLQRLSVTAALAAGCISAFSLAAYWSYIQDWEKVGLFPRDGITLVMISSVLGAISFAALRILSRNVSLLYLVNVSLAGAVLLVLLPSAILTFGMNISPRFHRDFDRLRAGQGEDRDCTTFIAGRWMLERS